MTTATVRKWNRVSKRNVCPVWGKPDWCLISQDGKAAIAARLRADSSIEVSYKTIQRLLSGKRKRLVFPREAP